jgi:predicted nucleotidyltransferase
VKKEDIKKILLENKEILKKYNVKSISLFGSYVMGEQREDSDIDLLVEFERDAFGKDFDGYTDNYENLKSFLENTLVILVWIINPLRFICKNKLRKESTCMRWRLLKVF